MCMKNSTGGFTLIEMMATIAIISILATGIIPLSQVVYKRTKEMELRNNLRLIRTALDGYKKLVGMICKERLQTLEENHPFFGIKKVLTPYFLKPKQR